MTQAEFIVKIAPLIQKYAKKYHIQVASPIIAQACLESAYGTSNKAKHHNYFGLKYRPNRVNVNNGTFMDGGFEQKANGSYYNINDTWFNFDTMEKGVEGYFQFINITNYQKTKDAATPKQYLEALRQAGYATSLSYVTNNMKVIEKWNLTQYDNFKEKSYLICSIVKKLNVFAGPSKQSLLVGTIQDKLSYTIVEEQNGFGKLKSGMGWVNLKYVKKV